MFSFRACSDIRILPSGKRKPSPSKVSNVILDFIPIFSFHNSLFLQIASFSDDTTFDLNQFEDYYDELFGGQSDNINAIDGPDREEDFEAATVMNIQTKKLKLIHKKLVLAKALKSLRHLITQSHEKEKEREEERRSPSSMFSPTPTYTTYTPYTPQSPTYTPQSSTYTPLLHDSKPLKFPSSALATSSFLDQLDMDRQTSSNLWSGSNSHGKRRKKRRRRRFSDLIYKLFA